MYKQNEDVIRKTDKITDTRSIAFRAIVILFELSFTFLHKLPTCKNYYVNFAVKMLKHF